MPPHKPKVVSVPVPSPRVTLPVLPLGSNTAITVLAGVTNDNTANFTIAEKYAWIFQSSTEVEISLYGPFPGGVVDPTLKAGLGKLDLKGTNVAVGNSAVKTPGMYLVELKSPTLATVELTVRPWTVFDTIFNQWYWKLKGMNSQ
jgi:hypothetical protein